MKSYRFVSDLLKGPLVMGVLCILIDEGIQSLWDDGAVNQSINQSVSQYHCNTVANINQYLTPYNKPKAHCNISLHTVCRSKIFSL